MTLAELRNTKVDMFTTVFIGNSQTKEIRDHMVTPRGYRYELSNRLCRNDGRPGDLQFSEEI